MTSTMETGVGTQTFGIYIKATPQAIWDAITKSEWTAKYGYGGGVEYDLRPGGGYRAFATEAMQAQGAPEVIVDGQVVEADEPHRLVQTWHALFGPETSAEAPTRLTWELDDIADGVTKVTLTHDLEDAPVTAGFVSGAIPNTGGGWPYVLSDLKTLLETGEPLAPVPA